MASVSNSNRASVATAAKARLGSQVADHAAQTRRIMQTLLNGGVLSQADKEIAATSGLTNAMNGLIKATVTAQTAQGPVAQSVAAVQLTCRVHDVAKAASAADDVYAAVDPRYARMSKSMHESWAGQAYVKTEPIQDTFFTAAGNVATVAGLGLSAVALPTMAKKTATGVVELVHEIHDPTATGDKRLNTLGETANAAAGTIFSAQGVVLGVEGTTQILSRSRTVGGAVQAIGNSKVVQFLGSPVGKAINVLLPVADGAVFIGSAVALRKALRDPKSKSSDKLKAELNFGLATIKLSVWMLPGVQVLHTLYNLASIGQLGMTIWEYRQAIGHAMVTAVRDIGWGILHPIQAARAIEGAVIRAAQVVVKDVVIAGKWIAGKLVHPFQSAQNVAHEVGTWNKALFHAADQQVTSWFVPGTTPAAPTGVAKVPAAPTLLAAAAPAPVALPSAPAAPVAPIPLAPAAPAAAAPIPSAPVPPSPGVPVSVAAAPAAAVPSTATADALKLAIAQASNDQAHA